MAVNNLGNYKFYFNFLNKIGINLIEISFNIICILYNEL